MEANPDSMIDSVAYLAVVTNPMLAGLTGRSMIRIVK